jgi:predicted permease
VPVFSLILAGFLLKRLRLTNDAFLQTADRLIYYFFFPILLFWKIGGAGEITLEWSFGLAALATLLAVYLLSLACIRFFRISPFQAGTFSQSCYRFNTYIGMAVVINALGEEAAGIFGILIGIMIPIINALAVSTLIWFSGQAVSTAEKNRLLLRALVSNPLIIGCGAGILYGQLASPFPRFLDNTFRLAAQVSLPLALLSIGGTLTFSTFKHHAGPSLLAAAIKLLALPVTAYGMLRLFSVTGPAFDVGLLFFALPTSTAIYVLSSQLNSDTHLATASIVISTLLSMISLTAVLAFIGWR